MISAILCILVEIISLNCAIIKKGLPICGANLTFKPHCTGRRAYNCVVQAMLQSRKNPLIVPMVGQYGDSITVWSPLDRSFQLQLKYPHVTLPAVHCYIFYYVLLLISMPDMKH